VKPVTQRLNRAGPGDLEERNWRRHCRELTRSSSSTPSQQRSTRSITRSAHLGSRGVRAQTRQAARWVLAPAELRAPSLRAWVVGRFRNPAGSGTVRA
jgi:hypothetical protein